MVHIKWDYRGWTLKWDCRGNTEVGLSWLHTEVRLGTVLVAHGGCRGYTLKYDYCGAH